MAVDYEHVRRTVHTRPRVESSERIAAVLVTFATLVRLRRGGLVGFGGTPLNTLFSTTSVSSFATLDAPVSIAPATGAVGAEALSPMGGALVLLAVLVGLAVLALGLGVWKMRALERTGRFARFRRSVRFGLRSVGGKRSDKRAA